MREPDFKGIAGRAWKIPHPKDGPPDWAATISVYLLNVPGAHPFWSFWALSVIHLRPIPGVRPAVITTPNASHEFMIVSIDPDWKPDEIVDDLGFSKGLPFLTPVDVVQQFIVGNDEQAAALAELCVRTVCDGHLSPDQDYRRAWKETIVQTAEHLRVGHHGN